jgi:hypothetical protein
MGALRLDRAAPQGAAPHDPETAEELSTALARAEREILRARHELAQLPPRQAEARARQIGRAALNEDAVGVAGRRIEREGRKAFDRAATAAAGTPIGTERRLDDVEGWGIDLIAQARALVGSAARGIAQDLREARRAGDDPADVAAGWHEEGVPLRAGGTLGGQLANLARNRTAELGVGLTRARAQSVGVGAATWATQGDDGVRATHAALSGQRFTWNNPPLGGPGAEPNCRCFAIPAFDEVEPEDLRRDARLLVIDPDDELDGRRTTEAIADAWRHAQRDMNAVLASPIVHGVAVLIGAAGSGKTTWARSQRAAPGFAAFDACNADRARRVALARRIRAAGKTPVAVWVRSGLDVCVARQARRGLGRQVPEVVIARQLSELRSAPPSTLEGWASVHLVDGTHERGTPSLARLLG